MKVSAGYSGPKCAVQCSVHSSNCSIHSTWPYLNIGPRDEAARLAGHEDSRLGCGVRHELEGEVLCTAMNWIRKVLYCHELDEESTVLHSDH